MPAKPLQLHDDVVNRVRAKVDGERFRSENDVINESLAALEQRDEPLEAWLRNVVVPTAEEMRAHPERALSYEQVRASLAAHARRARRGS